SLCLRRPVPALLPYTTLFRSSSICCRASRFVRRLPASSASTAWADERAIAETAPARSTDFKPEGKEYIKSSCLFSAGAAVRHGCQVRSSVKDDLTQVCCQFSVEMTTKHSCTQERTCPESLAPVTETHGKRYVFERQK